MRTDYAGLVIDPCIPTEWREFEVTRGWRGAEFHIRVENPDGVSKGVRAATLNGQPVQFPIPPQPAGSVNQIVVTMG